MGWNYIHFRNQKAYLEDGDVVRSSLLMSDALSTMILPAHMSEFREYLAEGILFSGIGCYTMKLDEFLNSDEDVQTLLLAIDLALRGITAYGERVPGSLFYRRRSSITFFDAKSEEVTSLLLALRDMLKRSLQIRRNEQSE